MNENMDPTLFRAGSMHINIGLRSKHMSAKEKKSIIKNRLRLALVSNIFISAYATGVVDCLLNPAYKGEFTFSYIIAAFFSSRQTLLFYPASFFINGAIALYICHKSWKEHRLDDKMGRNFKYSEKISPYGGAHVMEPYEYVDIAQIRRLEDCKGIIVGQLTENGEECVDFNASRINSHMYVTATSGSGKTYGFVKPYIFQSLKRRHSLILTDPKGELYRDTAGFLMDNGYHVRRLDFKNLDKSDGWDCLKLLRGKNMRTKVQIFTNAVISNISPNDNSIFAKGSDSLLQALILRVLLGHDFTEKEKNIKSVYQMLQNPAGYAFLDQMFDKNVLNDEEMASLPPYLAYKQGSENLSANIATHLANGLQLFQDDQLCRVLSTDDIDLILPGKEPCAYYCVFPDDHDTYRFVISLFFTMFFIELVDFADDQPDLKLPIAVDFLLDEFPSIGIIPDWAKKMSTVRSRGISCVMITQDFTQLKQNYKETWATILNNCGALVTLGINEMETAEWVSKRIGETSIEVESSSTSEVAGQRRNPLVSKQSVGVGKRSLFTPSEIFEIGKDNNLVVIAGRNPIYSMKTPYTIFKEAERLRVIQKEDILCITESKKKKEFRNAEAEYIEMYWKTHSLIPKGDPHDLTDALYTIPDTNPLLMLFEILQDDIKTLTCFFNRMVRRENLKREQSQRLAGDKSCSAMDVSMYDLAEMGAFQMYYEKYSKRCQSEQFYLDEEDLCSASEEKDNLPVRRKLENCHTVSSDCGSGTEEHSQINASNRKESSMKAKDHFPGELDAISRRAIFTSKDNEKSKNEDKLSRFTKPPLKTNRIQK